MKLFPIIATLLISVVTQTGALYLKHIENILAETDPNAIGSLKLDDSMVSHLNNLNGVHNEN